MTAWLLRLVRNGVKIYIIVNIVRRLLKMIRIVIVKCTKNAQCRNLIEILKYHFIFLSDILFLSNNGGSGCLLAGLGVTPGVVHMQDVQHTEPGSGDGDRHG